MKWFIIIILSICTLPSNAFEQEKALTDEQQLRQLKSVLWPKAYRTNDITLLDSILDDSFQFIQNDGSLSDKKQELALLNKSQWQPKSFRYEIQRLDIYDGHFAVVSGTGYVTPEEGAPYQYVSSNHLIKKEGQWRAISSHVSGFTEIKVAQ